MDGYETIDTSDNKSILRLLLTLHSDNAEEASSDPIRKVKFRILAESSLISDHEVSQEYCLNIYCEN